MLFLVLLLAEWGSHGVVAESSPTLAEHVAQYDGGDHDDPCRTLILCGDSSRHDQQMPTLGHDVARDNKLLEWLPDLQHGVLAHNDPLPTFDLDAYISRRISPLSQPPETTLI